MFFCMIVFIPPIEVLVGLVDCVIIEGERVREVQLNKNVVRVRWDVEEVLLLLC